MLVCGDAMDPHRCVRLSEGNGVERRAWDRSLRNTDTAPAAITALTAGVAAVAVAHVIVTPFITDVLLLLYVAPLAGAAAIADVVTTAAITMTVIGHTSADVATAASTAPEGAAESTGGVGSGFGAVLL